MPDFSIEEKFNVPVIGLDEVGRGPLAGPVISCGCYFKNYTIQKEFSNFIGDSKKLSAKKREASFKFLQDLKKEIALVELEADLIKEANEELVKEKKKLNSGKDALEGVARTELGLIKPGEKFYVFKEEVKDDNSTDR